jgi:hypothetical protein
MLEIFEREKGSMLAGTILITWRREEWWSWSPTTTQAMEHIGWRSFKRMFKVRASL